MSLKKTPPKFQNGMPYKTWKNKIDMWELVKTIEKKKDRAIVVLLESLEGKVKAEKAVQDLKASGILYRWWHENFD